MERRRGFHEVRRIQRHAYVRRRQPSATVRIPLTGVYRAECTITGRGTTVFENSSTTFNAIVSRPTTSPALCDDQVKNDEKTQ